VKSSLGPTLVLFACFGSAILLNLAFGWFSLEDVRAFLAALRARPVEAGLLMIGLLAVDSVLAVPTLGTLVVGGNLLGPFWGAACGWVGMTSAGAICYAGGRFGAPLFVAEAVRARARADVDRIGPVPLLFARAIPVLPETLSAMAGFGGLDARHFLLYFGLGNLPFALVGAWSGSVSTLGNPWPALFAAVGMTALAAVGLRAVRARQRRP